jgi:hypothetical protein
MTAMTVGDLRKALEGVRDDMPILMSYDCGVMLQYLEKGKDAVIDTLRSKRRITEDGPIEMAGTTFFRIGDEQPKF